MFLKTKHSIFWRFWGDKAAFLLWSIKLSWIHIQISLLKWRLRKKCWRRPKRPKNQWPILNFDAILHRYFIYLVKNSLAKKYDLFSPSLLLSQKSKRSELQNILKIVWNGDKKEPISFVLLVDVSDTFAKLNCEAETFVAEVKLPFYLSLAFKIGLLIVLNPYVQEMTRNNLTN